MMLSIAKINGAKDKTVGTILDQTLHKMLIRVQNRIEMTSFDEFNPNKRASFPILTVAMPLANSESAGGSYNLLRQSCRYCLCNVGIKPLAQFCRYGHRFR